jgi:hypothetical protein
MNNLQRHMDMVLLIATGVCSRFMPHPANFTAVGGIAIFSGSHFSFKKSLLILMATMLMTDAVLGLHPVMWATYGSLLLALVLGRSIKNKKTVRNIAGVTVASSVIFYVITNFAVWVVPGSMYPKTVTGLLDSYIMAIPFFRNSLLGDLTYTGVFFTAFEFVTRLQRRPSESLSS